jgi:MFS family permease
MSAAALIQPEASPSPGSFERLRAALGAGVAAVMGVAPHVLHHAGPLAGAAILAGATGKLLFGVIGLILAVPMLRRLHRRTGSWRAPSGVLALMAAVFAISSFVVGPALTGSGETQAPTKKTPALPGGVSPSEHESHHR